MLKKEYHWDLVDNSNESSRIRYCHNCGKQVVFKDSKQRRRNANGKNIFEYAIYKCGKGHTWNKSIGRYSSQLYIEPLEIIERVAEKQKPGILNLWELKNEGVQEVEIILGEVLGRWRIDKILSNRFQGLSRNQVSEMIRLRRILLDGKAIMPDTLLKASQRITILL